MPASLTPEESVGSFSLTLCREDLLIDYNPFTSYEGLSGVTSEQIAYATELYEGKNIEYPYSLEVPYWRTDQGPHGLEALAIIPQQKRTLGGQGEERSVIILAHPKWVEFGEYSVQVLETKNGEQRWVDCPLAVYDNKTHRHKLPEPSAREINPQGRIDEETTFNLSVRILEKGQPRGEYKVRVVFGKMDDKSFNQPNTRLTIETS